MERPAKQHPKDFLSSKRRADGTLSKKDIAEYQKLKKEFDESESKTNTGFPGYLNLLILKCEILRKNGHNEPCLYTLPTLFYLTKTQEKIRKRNALEYHVIDREFQTVLKCTDEKTLKNSIKKYSKIIKDFLNTGL